MQSKLDLETLANLTQDLLIVATIDGFFVSTNPATINTLGYSIEELKEKPFLSWVHPEDQEETIRAMSVLSEGQQVVGFRNRYFCKDGSTVWLEWNAKTSEDGKLIYAVARNVSEQVQETIHLAEKAEMLEMAQKLSGVGYWQVLFQPEKVFWSDEVKKIHGYEVHEDEPSLEEAFSFYHPEDRDTVRFLVDEALENKLPFNFHMRLINRQGQTRYVKSAGQPLLNKDREIIGIIGVFADETSEFLANQDMQEVLKMAQEATQAKTSFLATMSHEIRTPLNGLIGMISLLNDTELTQEQMHFAKMASQSGEHLLTLINDILDFSKLESGVVELELEYFHLGDELQKTLDIVRPHVMSKGLELVLELDPRLPQVYRGDCTRLRQVVMNLLSNAVKFTQDGGIYVRVSFASSMTKEIGEQIDLILEVEDTGLGIPEDYQERLFNEFVQVNQQVKLRSDEQKGTGLGLNISRRIMKLMNGSLKFQSKVGVGSTFSMQVPLEIAAPELVSKEPEQMEEVLGYTELKPLSILVAEDNTVNQMLMRSMLKKMNQNIHLVANGLEAVQAANELDFDLILMDINMPIMDGLEASEKILKHKPDQVVYALTAHVIPEIRERASQIGLFGYLTKPVRQWELLQTLQTHSGQTDSTAKKSSALEDSMLQLDLERLLELKDLMEENFYQYLGAYFSNNSKNLDLLAKAIEEDNEQKLRDLAHEVKGSAMNNGALRSAQYAAILQDDPYEQEKFLQTFAKLKKDLEEVEVLMRKEFAQDIAILESSEQE